MHMLVSMTLTLMQGHNGSAKLKYQRGIISTTEQAIRIKLATTVDHNLCDLDFKKKIEKDEIDVPIALSAFRDRGPRSQQSHTSSLRKLHGLTILYISFVVHAGLTAGALCMNRDN